MAKLVIGTSKQTVVPAVVRDKSPEIYRVFEVSNTGVLENSTSTPFLPLPNTVKDITTYGLANCYAGTNSSFLSGLIDLSNLTKLTNSYACYRMFFQCDGITSVDLSNLTAISGQYVCNCMFQNCNSLTSVDLSSLATIGSNYSCQNMFDNCDISNINLSSLMTIDGTSSCSAMLRLCNLTTIDLSGLTNILGRSCCSSMFDSAPNLVNVRFDSLKVVNGQTCCSSMFYRCTSLTSLSFPALTSSSFGTRTDQFTNMLTGCSNVNVHFPSNIQSKIGSWTSITSGFGGTNTTVLFDLPATNHLIGANTVEYERNPKYDTPSVLAWRVNGTDFNSTTYYTSGITDPVVGNTIYSDSACTQAITTISSIA